MKQLMIKSLTVISCLIILILFVIQVAKNKAPEYFPGDSQDCKFYLHAILYLEFIITNILRSSKYGWIGSG